MTPVLMAPPQASFRAGVGLMILGRQRGSSEAWKKAVGSRPVEARLAVLDNDKTRWDTFGVSFLGQCVLVAILVALPLFIPEKLNPLMHYKVIAIGAPLTEIPLPPKPPKMQPKIKPVLAEVEEPPVQPKTVKLFAPRPAFPTPPKPKPVDLKTPELKPVDFEAAKLAVKADQPVRPRDPVSVGNLPTTGSAAPAPMNAPVAEAPKKKSVSGESASTPVNILDKPRPEYSPEARQAKIEGDVVVEVVFLASGQVQVNRVVSSLGHGLDQAALRAAQQIKFKPARNDGQLVDFPARVRIEFRLAY